MKAYSRPYNFPWATTEVIKQLPTPGFIWPNQLGPPVDRPGGYYNEQPYEGVMNGGAPMQVPVAYSGYNKSYRGYGAIAPVERSEKIWFTPEVYTNADDAVHMAGEYAEGFHELGYTVTGLGLSIATAGSETQGETYKGYILFAGEGPPEARPLGAEITVTTEKKGVPWWHYGLAATGGFVFAGILSLAIGSKRMWGK